MKKLIVAMTVVLASVAQAYIPNEKITKVQSFEKDGYLTETFVEETYADADEYCSRIIVVKTEIATGKIVSTDSKETCSRF